MRKSNQHQQMHMGYMGHFSISGNDEEEQIKEEPKE
jgi:hypothetical protein